MRLTVGMVTEVRALVQQLSCSVQKGDGNIGFDVVVGVELMAVHSVRKGNSSAAALVELYQEADAASAAALRSSRWR